MRTFFSFAVLLVFIGWASVAGAGQIPDGDASNLAPDVYQLPDELRDGPIIEAACCKICKKGKACGDSCIAREKTCTKGPGCACDAAGYLEEFDGLEP
jgi:hypothetical protein